MQIHAGQTGEKEVEQLEHREERREERWTWRLQGGEEKPVCCEWPALPPGAMDEVLAWAAAKIRVWVWVYVAEEICVDVHVSFYH